VGEPDFPTPENIKEAGKKALDNNQTKYTINSGTVELRKAILNKLKRDDNLDYDISEVIVNSGAKHSVFNTLFATVNKGDEVIIPAPYWVSYPEMAKMAEGVPVFVDTDEKNGFKMTPEQLEKAITPKTKVLIICNPSNPTGSAYTEEELKGIAKVCSKYNFLIISDEIYEKLIYDDYKFISFAAISPEIKKRTVVVNGVSKSYAMTGWRIGYCAGPKDIISAINKIQSNTTSHASSISQYASVEALNGTQETVKSMLGEFRKRREYLYSELTSIKGITCYKPEGAFFLFPNISAFFGKSVDDITINNSTDFAMYLLNKANIAVVPGSAFGAEGFIRISYATSMESIKEACRRLKETLQHLK
ncbi:MAG: pyridoxal phosphate-dependent aminotransferase, partial [Ignavibacteriaceae bacterium]